ncbi:MAG: hypothetical protein R2727_09460 [Bacteroidales bacterium]
MQVVTAVNRRKEPVKENFGGLDNISEIMSGKYYKYTSGHFKTYQEAVQYRRSIGNLYPDAFVIAVKQDKIIPLQEAIEATIKE